ncbi:MAG: hypothetical protein IPG92_13615 [Flavobacteriales bacterium]|nr:hypothetical protein [Flavobacteriales bacterium]
MSGGWFLNEADLDNDPNAVQVFDSNGSENGFVMRLDPAGLTEWAVRFSGIGQCRVLDVEEDDDGNLHVAVKFDGSLDVDPGAGSVLLYAAGMSGDLRDVAVVKLDAQGLYLTSAQFNDVEYQMEGVILEINSAGQPVVAFISDYGIIHSYTLSGADLSTISSFDFRQHRGRHRLPRRYAVGRAGQPALRGSFLTRVQPRSAGSVCRHTGVRDG